METKTTIQKMLAGNKIYVPIWQRAYSWQSPSQDNSKYLKTHTDVFFNDLIDYDRSSAKAPYYFGHFMFEKDKNSCYAIIDGQQRLTTIVIMLSALFRKLSEHREFTDMEVLLFEDMIRRKSHYHFSTVDYDNQFLLLNYFNLKIFVCHI